MSNKILEGLYYSKSDEWVKVENDVATLGITFYAQEQLGDIVYIENMKTGTELKKGDTLTTIESVKAVAEVFSPLSGEIMEVNEDVINDPSQINQDPYGNGWFVKIKMSQPDEIKELMNAVDYSEYRKE